MTKRGRHQTVLVVAAIIVIIVIGGLLVMRIERAGQFGSQFTNLKPVSLVNSNINFEVIDWPTLLVGVGFTNSSLDEPFLHLVHELGAETLAIETDPVFFQTYQNRFSSLVSEARTMGLKIHIINQLGYTSWYKVLGLTYPFSTDPSFQSFENFQIQAVRAYAKYDPNYLSLIAEPGLMQEKVGANYSLSQWQSLIAVLAQTVKAVSPETQTWIDLVPQNSFDMKLLPYLVNITQLDGIGLDVYGNVAPFSTTSKAATYITSHGKLGGLTETWAFSLYSSPSTDIPSNIPAEAKWVSTSGVVQWAVQNNFTSIFNPFFSSFYTSTDPLPSFTVKGLQLRANTYYAQLLAGQTTQIFRSYRNLIAASS
ncbi:MAG: hypothetical protein JRN20_10020 [Nitrososphaerota archaeon]|nr:hypothetical protein [Nitrososphaerota archaeon]